MFHALSLEVALLLCLLYYQFGTGDSMISPLVVGRLDSPSLCRSVGRSVYWSVFLLQSGFSVFPALAHPSACRVAVFFRPFSIARLCLIILLSSRLTFLRVSFFVSPLVYMRLGCLFSYIYYPSLSLPNPVSFAFLLLSLSLCLLARWSISSSAP